MHVEAQAYEDVVPDALIATIRASVDRLPVVSGVSYRSTPSMPGHSKYLPRNCVIAVHRKPYCETSSVSKEGHHPREARSRSMGTSTSSIQYMQEGLRSSSPR